MKNRQWLLAKRPDGALKDSDFTFVETEAPAPGEGEVVIRNLVLSCDPTQRALDRRRHLSAGGQDRRGRALVRRGPDRSVEQPRLQGRRCRARPRGLAGLCRDEAGRLEQAAPRRADRTRDGRPRHDRHDRLFRPSRRRPSGRRRDRRRLRRRRRDRLARRHRSPRSRAAASSESPAERRNAAGSRRNSGSTRRSTTRRRT